MIRFRKLKNSISHRLNSTRRLDSGNCIVFSSTLNLAGIQKTVVCYGIDSCVWRPKISFQDQVSPLKIKFEYNTRSRYDLSFRTNGDEFDLANLHHVFVAVGPGYFCVERLVMHLNSQSFRSSKL